MQQSLLWGLLPQFLGVSTKTVRMPPTYCPFTVIFIALQFTYIKLVLTRKRIYQHQHRQQHLSVPPTTKAKAHIHTWVPTQALKLMKKLLGNRLLAGSGRQRRRVNFSTPNFNALPSSLMHVSLSLCELVYKLLHIFWRAHIIISLHVVPLEAIVGVSNAHI